MSYPKNILITSDDGYKSAAVRILTKTLKNDFNLKIVGTKTQQSSVGAKLSAREGGEWGKDEIHGVEALWVDGTPCDGIEAAKVYFDNHEFDLVISGVNFGANIGTTIVSGTVSAAIHALEIDIAKKAIAMSLDMSGNMSHLNHDKTFIENFLDYPGKHARDIIDYILKNDFWGAEMINVNFPKSANGQMKFCKPFHKNYDFYSSKINLGDDGKFKYGRIADKTLDYSNDYDAIALRDGFITLTPFKRDNANDAILGKLVGRVEDIL